MLLNPKIFIGFALCVWLLPKSVTALELDMAYSEQLATATIAMEARGEGPDGELAVAFVLRNRMNDGRWGSNLASVVLAPEQFSGWNTSDPNRKTLAEMKNDDPVLQGAAKALELAFSGLTDITEGATHYYSVKAKAPPFWITKGTFTVQIGNHRFYKNVP